MEALVDVIRYLSIVLFTALALVSVREWRRHRGRAARWLALTFGVLAAVAIAFALLPDESETALAEWVRKAALCGLVLFPYFLYRFATCFRPPSRALDRLVVALTGLLLAVTLLLPEVAVRDVGMSGLLVAYMVALLVQWATISLIVAVRLWRAGRAEPSVARRRMRLLSVASVGLTVTFVLAGATPEELVWADLLVRSLALASAGLFFLGFSPPAVLRTVWRRPEDEALRDAVADLMAGGTAEEITTAVLPKMANIVGARAVALVDGDGRVVGSHGLAPELAADVESARAVRPRGDDEATGLDVVDLPLPVGSLVVWTSPYAPYFGKEELELLRSFGTLVELALDRSRLFAQERETLERADELKRNFIALASHELRTPAAVVHGIAATLHLRGDELTDDQRHHLRKTLYEQTDRLRRLVDQLLDLSRLDANAIPIAPERIQVRRRIEDLLLLVAGERAGEIELRVPADLETVADPDAFDRVVSNLVANALRYGEPPILVAAGQSDRHFRLLVEDRGRGIAREFVPRLFDRFSRSPGSSKTGGTGLGLSIAESYAHAHGGELLYEEAEPHGARFQLALPVVPGARTGD